MSETYTPFDPGLDPSSEEILVPDSSWKEGEVAIIRTSDRINFKRCRRRWGWNSHLKYGLGPKEAQNPLWLGSGMHFAFEDYHGYNLYGSPAKAFEAYCDANYKLRGSVALPASYHELRELGIGLLRYYSELWLSDRDPMRTLWVDGIPQVEVRVLLDIPFPVREIFPTSRFTKAMYSLTIDRVVEDNDGLLWLVDYKSAKQFATLHYATDPQIGAYYWAAGHIYGKQIAGFIYQQHRKSIPEPPRFLANGTLSTDAQQLTTHRAYRAALVNLYGNNIEKWPARNLNLLNEFAQLEGPDSDKFIRRDRIYRNEYSFETEGAKILMELEDMLNPDLPLYPNPTRDCAYMCPFLHACVSMDDGSDWKYELDMAHAPRGKEQDSWRQHLLLQAPQPPLLYLVKGK